MKYGLYLPNFGAFGDARLMASLACDAEQSGWEGFFTWDHINRPWLTPVVDTWVAMTAVAVSTSRIRFGPLVTPLPRRRPWKLARESVSVDHLSGGRLILGVGTGGFGGMAKEWENFGEELDLHARAEMLDEGLDVLMGLWSGQPFEYTGKHYQVKDTQFIPTPVQSPHIPIWVGGNWPHTRPFRRAARWDGVVPQVDLKQGNEFDQLKQAVQFTRAQRKDDGPFEVVYTTSLLPGQDPAQLADRVAQYAEAGITWLLDQIYPQHYGAGWEDEWPVKAMRARILQGPPA